jgi:predicted nucleic acid-binding protein
MVVKYFFDAYAIIEIIKVQENYSQYAGYEIFTNALHLAEVYYHLLKSYNEETAHHIMDNTEVSLIDISHNTSVSAAKFRYKNRKKKLSYADCIGYITAKANKLRFLTGDKEFKNLPNVEFVPK